MAFPWDIAASAALPLIGGLFGHKFLDDEVGGGDDAAATMQQGIQYLERLQQEVPEISDQIVHWSNLLQEGYISPTDVIKLAEQQAADSKLRDFTPDKAHTDASEAGLAELRKIAEGGFSVSDQAHMEEIRRRIASQERGQREAILQSAQERGAGGSGLEMASNLMAQQSAADRRALENLMTAARIEDRKMAASGQAAELGAALRGQEFGEARSMDEADRLINQFNAQMRMRKGEADAARAERAQYQALERAQHIADINKQRNYEAALRNAGLHQQRFQNKLGLGQAMMGAYGGKAGAQEGRMNRRYKLLGGGLGGAGQILGDYYSSRNRPSYQDWSEFQKWKRKNSPT